jgi:hypothetical protein
MITLNVDDPIEESGKILGDRSHIVHVIRLRKDQKEFGPEEMRKLQTEYDKYIAEVEGYHCQEDICNFERRLNEEEKPMDSNIRPPVPSFVCSEVQSLLAFHENKCKFCVVEPEFQQAEIAMPPDHPLEKPVLRRSSLYGHLSIPYLYPDLKRRKEKYDLKLRTELIRSNYEAIAVKQKRTQLLSKLHRQKLLECGTVRIKRPKPRHIERPLSSFSSSAIAERDAFDRKRKEERQRHREEEAKKEEEDSGEESLFRATFAGKARPPVPGYV